MATPIVILVHGMGNHTAPKPESNKRGSFGKECIGAFNTALKMYPSLEATDIEDEVEFFEIHYNNIFEDARRSLAENGQTVRDFIAGAGRGTPLGNVPGLVQAVADFEAGLGEDEFLYTHWLDVVFYKLYWGEFVRARVAEQFADVLSRHNAKDIHVLAHSLGTGVFHDACHKIYNGDYADDDRIADLSPVTHKLRGIWMVANVSRLLSTVLPIADPYKSLVKPGGNGITTSMMNIHHKHDPFTWPRKFSRPPSSNWAPRSVHNRGEYRDIQTSVITQMNTHSVTQYIHDPAVHLYLFQWLGIPIPPKAQCDEAEKAYKEQLLTDARTKLEARFGGITKDASGTLTDFFNAASAIKDAIEND